MKKKKQKVSIRRKKEGKHGAIELSMGTIVILVLAMMMLVMGIVLIRAIFSGAKYNVDTMNKGVQDEINKMFAEDSKGVIYLPNQKVEIKQGKDWGVGFAILNKGASQQFKWTVTVDDARISERCGIRETEAEKWISTGGSSSGTEIATGDKYYGIIRFNIPENSVDDISACIIHYKMAIKKQDGTSYTTLGFDVDVT